MTALPARDTLEYLRVMTMISQKIEAIWAIFLTAFGSVFGLTLLTEPAFATIYIYLLIFGISVFTAINFRALWNHYRLLFAMATEFKKLNGSFPAINSRLDLFMVAERPLFLLITHVPPSVSLVVILFEKHGILVWP